MYGNTNELAVKNDDKDNARKKLRLAQSSVSSAQPRVCLTYGNNNGRCHEATDTSPFENDLLQMTNHLYRLRAMVERLILKELCDIVVNKKSSSSSDPTRNDSSPTDMSNQCPVDDSSDNPFKECDTIAAQIASIGSTFSGHTDTKPGDNSNYNDADPRSHNSRVEVITFNVIFQQDKSIVDGTHATMRHGEPGGKYCEILGHFEEEMGGDFVFKKNNMNDDNNEHGIPIEGGQCVHWQLAGSQGQQVHHFPKTPKHYKHRGKNMVRCVFSSRACRGLQRTKEESEALRKGKMFYGHSLHEHTGMLDFMLGNMKVMVAKENPKNSTSLSCGDSRSRKVPSNQRRKGRPKPSTPRYINGKLLLHEYTARLPIDGLSKNYKKRDLITNGIVAQRVSDKNLTLVYVDSKKKDRTTDVQRTFVGPAVVKDDESPTGHRLMVPGDIVDSATLDVSSNITSNRRNSSIVNPNNPDTIIVNLLGKNHSSFAKAFLAALKRKRGMVKPSKEVTESSGHVILRGVGGVEVSEGLYMVETSKPTSRSDPTTIIQSGQKPFSATVEALRECAAVQMCVNLYFRLPKSDMSIFIGTYIVKVNLYGDGETCLRLCNNKAYSDKSSLEDLMNEEKECMNSTLQEISAILENQFKIKYPSCIDKSIEKQMLAATSACNHFILEPVNLDCIKKNNATAIVPWHVVEVDDKDINIPRVIQNESVHNSLEKILRLPGYPYLSEEGINRVEKVLGTTCEDEDIVASVLPEEKAEAMTNTEEMFSLVPHAIAMTMLKTSSSECYPEDENGKHNQILPPRKFFNDLSKYDCFKEVVRECKSVEENQRAILGATNLKPVTMKASHHPHSQFDPSIAMAMYFNGTHDLDPNHIREGPNFITSKETGDVAWSIIETCIICSFIAPSFLLELLGTNKVMDPTFLKVDDIRKMKNFDINSNHYNHVFKSSMIVKNTEEFITSMESITRGSAGFITCIQQALAANTSDTRHETMTQLITFFNQMGFDFTPFQVHTLMRVIETNILNPFGEVKSVPSGVGSTQCGKCFIKQYRNDPTVEEDHKKLSDSKIIEEHMPSWLLKKWNERVATMMNGSDIERKMIEAELAVCALTYNNSECYHLTGIRRKLDSSDMEQMMCFGNVQIQYTQSSRAQTMLPYMHSPRYLPIKSSWRPCDLPIHQYIVKYWNKTAKDEYVKLLIEPSYNNRQVNKLFTIDLHDRFEELVVKEKKTPGQKAKRKLASGSQTKRKEKKASTINRQTKITDEEWLPTKKTSEIQVTLRRSKRKRQTKISETDEECLPTKKTSEIDEECSGAEQTARQVTLRRSRRKVQCVP